jgi:hypothetical protein
VWSMLETHIMMSLLIFHLTFLLVLCLIFLMYLTIAHMVLVYERMVLRLDALVSTHALIVVFVPPPRRHGFSARGVYSHFEPSRFDGPCFLRRGSHPTSSIGEVQMIVKTFSGRMVKCWIPNIFLTNPSIESSTFSHSIKVMDGGLKNKWLMDFDCSRHMTSDKK